MSSPAERSGDTTPVTRLDKAVEISLCQLLAPVLPSKSPLVDIAKLAFIGLVVTSFFLFTAPYLLPGGGDHFLHYADALAHGTKLHPHLAQRDIGFAALVLLSGYTVTGSLIGITLVHAIFAILMPILIYLSVYRISSAAAFYVALFAMASLAPVAFMKWIHHDQAYVFLLVLTAAMVSAYVQSKRPANLYFSTAAALATSLTRPAGNLLVPIVLVTAYALLRGRILHYAICAALFVAVSLGYLWHRYEIFDMAHNTSIPSYTGQQVFYNVYINGGGSSWKQLLSRAGPNMARVIANFEEAIRPSPRESSMIANYASSSTVAKQFAEQHIYPYTADQFLEVVFARPNYEYYTLLMEATPEDQVILKATLEMARRHPLYVLRYSARNFGLLLLRPGYAHTRYNVQPFGRIGLEPPILLAGAAGLDSISPRAAREVQFMPLSVEPSIFSEWIETIREMWIARYHAVVDLTLFLMTVAWVWVAAFAVCRLRRTSRLCRFTDPLGGTGIAAAIFATTVLLFYNMAVTAAFVDPDYRYHHFILPLRFLIAGYGLAIVFRILQALEFGAALGRAIPFSSGLGTRALAVVRSHDGFELAFSHHPRRLTFAVGFITFVIFAAWTWFMIAHTG